jgi:Peptidase family C50
MKQNSDVNSVPQLPVQHDFRDLRFIICPKACYQYATNKIWLRYISLSKDYSLECELLIESDLKGILLLPSLSTCARARVLYLLGLLPFTRLKRNGYFKMIRDKIERLSPESYAVKRDAEMARHFFSQSLSLLGTDCTTISRNCKRHLALLHCSSDDCHSIVLSTLLINSSVGNFQGRQILRSRLQESTLCTHSSLPRPAFLQAIENPLSVNDCIQDELVTELTNTIPIGCKFVSFTLCPSGELLLSALWKNLDDIPISHKSACILPDEEGGSMYNEMITPLDKIIQQSQVQLSGASTVFNINDKEYTREWWNARKRLNFELESLLRKIESKLLQSDSARDILLDTKVTAVDDDESDNLTCRNLNDMFSQVNIDENSPIANDDKKIDQYLSCEQDKSPKIKKANRAVQRLLTSTMESSPLLLEQHCINSGKDIASNCIFLILDESLHRFPFESMDCFKGQTICRIPSLLFGVTRFFDHMSMSLNMNPYRTSFVLDPESNLGGTRNRLLPVLQSLSKSFENKWKGSVGETPAPGFIENALTRQDGLFLYFGHGNAKQYFSRKDIECLNVDDSTKSKLCHDGVKASVILMGCSSGRLESINGRDSGKSEVNYEPEGLALSYLAAGAPCVIGNLWDVTDRDIDRLAIEFLVSLPDPNDCRSLAQRLSEARSACKLRFLVGGAAVCYGFPVVPTH